VKKRQWTNLKGAVPEEVVEVSEKELAIRAATDERRNKSMKELAAEYQGLVEEEEFADLAAKKRDIEYQALERLIGDELKRVQELSGQDTWRGEGQMFSPKISIIPVVADKETLTKFIKDEGMEALLTLEYPRLKSLVVSTLEKFATMTPEERAALPSGVTIATPVPGVKLFIKNGIHRTKS